MRAFLIGLMSSAVVASAFAADGGVYVTGSGGVSLLMDSEISGSNRGLDGSELVFGTGYVGRTAVGWEQGDFKVEAEGSFSRNPIEERVSANGGTRTLDANLNIFTLGANVYYAPRFDGLGPVRPFIGVGVGGSAMFTTDDTSDSDVANTGTTQSIIGADVYLTDRFAIGGEYRFVWSPETEFNDSGSSAKFEISRRGHEAGLRLSYAFWDPKPQAVGRSARFDPPPPSRRGAAAPRRGRA